MHKLKFLLTCFLSLFSISILLAQTRVIKGKVTNASDKSEVVGASVTVKGGKQAAITGTDGSFSITAPSGSISLLISSVGFTTKEIAVNADQSEVTIEISSSSQQLNEVVVTALGISRQTKTLTYAAQKIDGDKLNTAREVNVANALQGKVAGVTITKNASGPGSSSKVLLRGSRSLQGNNQPLYVIDGVPMDNSSREQPSSTFGGRDGGDGIGMINPDDIETMTVLKGASAAALYGSAGQNGAIIITTKKGRSGKIGVEYNGGLSLETAAVFPELQQDYAQGDGGIYGKNSEHSWGPKITGQTDTLWNGKVTNLSGQPDRLKDFFRTGRTLTNTVSAIGGTEKMQTYFSYGNTMANGILRNHDLNRHNVNFKINNTFSDKLSFEAKFNYIYEAVNNKAFIGEAPNSVISLYRSPISIPLREMQEFEYTDINGDLKQSYWKPQSSILENPYWIMNRDIYFEKKDRIIGLISGKYKFTEWLNLQLRGSIDKTMESTESKIYADSYYSTVGSNYITGSGTHYSSNIDALLSFKHDLGKMFSLSGNLGGSIQEGRYMGNSQNATGLYKPNFFFMSNAKAAQNSNYYGRSAQVQSLYATASLAFHNYLYLDVTARNDWSSALPIGKSSYFYPSVGLTGVISDMVHLPSWISFGKIRLSSAGSGAGGSEYQGKTYYSVGAGGQISTPTIQSLSNYKPELTQAYEAGLEWRFFNNRIGFDLTLYTSDTKNQLLAVGAPSASTYTQKYINAGLIRNKGIELVFNATPLKSSNFSWDLTLNYAHNKNTVIRLTPQQTSVILVDDRDAAVIVQEGGSYGDLYVKSWKKDDQGRHLVNADGYPMVSDNNDTKIGNYNPDFMLGLSNSFSFRGFYLSFLIDYRKGGYVISGTQALIDADGHSKRSLQGRDGKWILDAVTEDGDKNTKAVDAQKYWSSIGDRYPVGEFYAYSATNIRLRELILGYSFNNKFLEATKFLKGVKLSLVGRNLVFFKRDAPFDPEMALGTGNGGGLEYGSLPSTRSIGINLKLSL